MTDAIRIEPAEGTWVVRAGGAVIGESTRALRLHEDGHEPVIYVPRADIAMAFLEVTDHRTTCPRKGEATYYTVVLKSLTIENAGWSYEDPIAAASDIAGHLAFAHDNVVVEQV